MQRVTRSRHSARETYNALSRWYDLMAGASEGPLRDEGLALLSAQPGESVLEIGYGTGQALVALAGAVGGSGAVVGVDLSDGMARVAQQRLSDSGANHRVSLCIADGLQPCFAPGSFDAIFMSFTLELFDTPEIPEVLARCAEMLRQDGRLAVVSLVKPEGADNLPVRAYEWAHRVLPSWVDCRPIFLRRLLLESGYSIAGSQRRSMWGLPVDIVLAVPQSG